MPYSVTTLSTNVRGTVTMVAGGSVGTMREWRSPSTLELDGTAMIERPPSLYEAAMAKTVCPPGPL